MRGIAHQHQVLLMKVRNNVGIDGTSEMYALRISDGQQMGNRPSPVKGQFLHQRVPAKRVSFLRNGWSKARRIQLREPDYVLFIHRQDADRQTAVGAVELIEVGPRPAQCIFTARQSHYFYDLGRTGGPIREQDLPGPRTHAIGGYKEIGCYPSAGTQNGRGDPAPIAEFQPFKFSIKLYWISLMKGIHQRGNKVAPA